jgi:hypothetical protein
LDGRKGSKASKRFFFEKKKQKTFICWGFGALVPEPAGAGVFLPPGGLVLFLQKKKCLLPSLRH